MGEGAAAPREQFYLQSIQIVSSPLRGGDDVGRCVYTDAIRVNQVGYLPRARKVFLLAYDQATVLPFDLSRVSFHLMRHDDDDEVSPERVLTGTLNTSKSRTPIFLDEGGEQVYEGDFSKVRRPGVYHIAIPALGQYSAAFAIAEKAYQPLLRDVLRFFYYARSGEEIREPFAEGHARLAHFERDTHAMYTYRSAGTRDVRGGWFDAGDAHKGTPVRGSGGDTLQTCTLRV